MKVLRKLQLWGDSYGNRVDRMTGCVAYLDGVNPSAVFGRGYYTRLAVTAWDVKNKKLVQKWAFDTGFNSSAAGYGDGNHHELAADVDGDGKQEVVCGSAVIDDNGKLLYTTGNAHGDALHIGDFVPSNPGLEIYQCLEDRTHAVSYTGSNDDLHQSKKGSVKLAELVSALLFAPAQEAGTLLEGAPDYFLLRNGSSGQYLTLTDAPADGVNVVQTDAPSINERYSLWKGVSDGNGYFNLISMADETKRLDVADGAKSNGTNIGIWSDTGSDAQCFKFMKQENGSYILATKASSGNSAVEVKNASDISGENVQEWERNGHACQTWFLDAVHTADMEVLQYDLNDDGVIDVFDLALMKREALQEEAPKAITIRDGFKVYWM